MRQLRDGDLLRNDRRIHMFIMRRGSLPNGNGIDHLRELRRWNVSGLDGI